MYLFGQGKKFLFNFIQKDAFIDLYTFVFKYIE